MKLKLVKAEKKYQRQITEMLEEWYASGEKIVPYAIRRLDYHNFEYYCEHLEVKDAKEGLVPDSTFFCMDEERDIMVGAVNIRHYLNEALLLNGGHIGDGVRPSERRKGIGTKMIGLALLECRKLGLDKVLMVCNKDNIGSAKSIMNNGGVLENEVLVDGVVEKRFWINLEETMTVVKFYDEAADELLKFAVILTKHNGKWVFCRHRERDSLEIPGGHREPGENIDDVARRELYEETGALKYEIKPVCVYSVTAPWNFDGEESFGMLYYADVEEFEGVLHSEIDEIVITEELPENWTYPEIQPKLLEEAERRGVR